MSEGGRERVSVVLWLEVDRSAALPLNEQIRRGIISLINDGSLPPGTRMPSSRQLANDLAVSRSVVVETYQQLTAEGWLESRSRSGTRVARLSPTMRTMVVDTAPAEAPRQARWNLVPGSADVRSFPRREWMSCLNTVIRRMSAADLDYPQMAGVPDLREELASYLGRVRAVRTTMDEVVLTAGFAQGLALVCRALQSMGVRAIALEDPATRGSAVSWTNSAWTRSLSGSTSTGSTSRRSPAAEPARCW